MITCKDCKKFAKITQVWKNGLEEVKVYGSCKHCGYEDKPDKIEYDYDDLQIDD